MANDILTGQYSLIAPFLAKARAAWLSGNPVDQTRVAAYGFYRALYWNDAGGFRLTIRGDEQYPVYIPSARRIVNTLDRYVATKMNFAVTGAADATPQELIDACTVAYDILFKRERWWSVFQQHKLDGIKTGDCVFGLFADPDKPEGRRISIKGIMPDKFFPITNPQDETDVWGQQILELVTFGDKQYVHVQRWLKPVHPEHPSSGDSAAPIAYENVTYDQENWTDPTKRKTFATTADLPMAELPGIYSLPFYHIRNNAQPGEGFGTSDLRGLERIFLAINQTATDEDLAVAMGGLGLFTSDSHPVDENGNDTNWIIGPKRVLELPVDGKFTRVPGLTSVSPSQDHMEWIQKQSESVFGISDVALGEADVAVAQSGIALALRMAPLLDAARIRDNEISDVLMQMFHDLKDWFRVYEGMDFGDDLTGCVIEPIFGDKLPVDRDAEYQRIMDLYAAKLIPQEVAWMHLRDLGFELPATKDLQRMMSEDTAAADPIGTRLAQEADPTAGL